MNTVQLTRHADLRRIEFGFTVAQVEAAVVDPELSYPADERQGRDRTIHQHGPVTAVLGREGIVITVMPAGKTTGYCRWTHAMDVPPARPLVRLGELDSDYSR